jgi:hypothetical protein
MVKSLNKYVKQILITLFLVTLVCGGIYILTINGESYKYSLEYLKRNKQIVEAIGEIKTIRLSFSGKSFVTTNAKEGNADYTIVVHGEKEKGIVSLVLKRNMGKWRVVRGDLVYGGGKDISLSGEE